MAEVSYINPLSNEGRQIIRQYGDLNQIFEEDEMYDDGITDGHIQLKKKVKIPRKARRKVRNSLLL